MTTKHYENVSIINATLEDEQIERTINIIQDSIKNNGGEISDLEKWGRKRLAYPINKAKSGYYLVIRFSAPTEMITQFERSLRLDENVIRFLTIALDKRALDHINNMEKQAAEAAESSQAGNDKESTSNES